MPGALDNVGWNGGGSANHLQSQWRVVATPNFLRDRDRVQRERVALTPDLQFPEVAQGRAYHLN